MVNIMEIAAAIFGASVNDSAIVPRFGGALYMGALL
jgi:hypothetical protein